MSTTFVITDNDNSLCSFLLEDGVLTEVWAQPDSRSLLGNIYIGKVKHLLKNIEAAFVEIAGRQNCFLPLSEARTPLLLNRQYDGRLLAGDEILVQVKREASKTKEPSLSARLTLSGRYVTVRMKEGKETSVLFEKTITAENKELLTTTLSTLPIPPELALFIHGREQEPEKFGLLLQEAKALLDKAEKLMNVAASRTVFSQLYQEKPFYLRQLEENALLPDRITTDRADVYTQLQLWLKQFGNEVASQLCFYQDENLSLFRLYGLSAKLEDALRKQVWLKSGGYLIIEATEALTVIDVNTGKFSEKKGVEETFIKINQEAALEVARQLRLRNISGIIVVDFINLSSFQHRKALMRQLREACSRDVVPTQVVDITPLGLVEITRKKVRKPLAEQLRKKKGRPE